MAEQLFQIGVKGLTRNSRGEILMLHMPQWKHSPAYWDIPGGRMNPGETFLQTLDRELQEEIGVGYVGNPRQLMSLLSSITIQVDDALVPLVLIVYEVKLPSGAKIILDPDSSEDDYHWFSPVEAAEKMAIKFSPDFCDMVHNL